MDETAASHHLLVFISHIFKQEKWIWCFNILLYILIKNMSDTERMLKTFVKPELTSTCVLWGLGFIIPVIITMLRYPVKSDNETIKTHLA